MQRNHRGFRARGVALATATIALAAIITGCAAQPGTEEEGPTVGLIVQNSQFFYQGIQDQLQELVAADGGQVIVENVSDDDGKVAQALDNFIQRQVDVILIPVLSADADAGSIKAAVAAGVPVVCYNQCIGDESKDVVSAFIRSDGTSLGTVTGEAAASYIKEQLGGVANIALLNCDIYVECQLRKAGFKDALDGLDVTYVADQEGFLADKATTVATDILTANPDVDIFWAVNEGGTVGARSAIAASANVGKTVVFGTDISPQISEFLTAGDGILLATTGQDSAAIVEASYAAAIRAINGEKTDPFDVLIPGVLYTPEHAE